MYFYLSIYTFLSPSSTSVKQIGRDSVHIHFYNRIKSFSCIPFSISAYTNHVRHTLFNSTLCVVLSFCCCPFISYLKKKYILNVHFGTLILLKLVTFLFCSATKSKTTYLENLNTVFYFLNKFYMIGVKGRMASARIRADISNLTHQPLCHRHCLCHHFALTLYLFCICIKKKQNI